MSLKFTDHTEPKTVACHLLISPKCSVTHLHGLIFIGLLIHCYLYRYVKVAHEPILSSFSVWSVNRGHHHLTEIFYV